MTEFYSWLQHYPAPVVALLAAGATVIFIFKYFIQKKIDLRFADKAEASKEENRANFEREHLAKDLSRRLDEAMGELYHWRKRRTTANDFFRHRGSIPLGDEIIALSQAWTELQANKQLLGQELTSLLQKQVQLIGAANNIPFDDDAQFQEKWKELGRRRDEILRASHKGLAK